MTFRILGFFQRIALQGFNGLLGVVQPKVEETAKQLNANSGLVPADDPRPNPDPVPDLLQALVDLLESLKKEIKRGEARIEDDIKRESNDLARAGLQFVDDLLKETEKLVDALETEIKKWKKKK
mgnify:CR=1 FL=1